jgi:histone-lysine N-methyltransferase SETD3
MFVQPYYDILPATLSNMPNFWTDDELDYLKGSYLQIQIEQRKDMIERDYNLICDVYPDFVDIATLTEFAWAKMCVCSRNFAVDINGKRTSVLVPYADMLNHLRPRETKWEYEDSVGGFVVTSMCRIPSGAEVFDSYGWKCNHRFLLNYGFSVERNIEADGYCPNEVR